MRILHTSDWHVGRTIRGRSRAAEHAAVLAEIAGVARDRDVDLVLVAGDLFDTAAPSPAAEALVYATLVELAEQAPVVVVAGNHDNPRRLAAVAPLLGLADVHVAPAVARPDHGGVRTLDAGGVPVRVALVPFLSQRGVVRADQLMALGAGDHAARYAGRVRAVIEALTAGFEPDAVNLVVAHLTVAAGDPERGGGERAAHTIFDYVVPPQVFPPSASYVALGHLHRPHRLPGRCPIHYAGSPLHLDFGERLGDKAVLVVDAAPGEPARVTPHVLGSGRKLVTLRGTLDDVAAHRDEVGDAYVRVVVTERARSGLADEVRALLPDAVEVAVADPEETPASPSHDLSTLHHAPDRLLAEYLDARGVDDPALVRLFRDLWDAVEGGEDATDATGAAGLRLVP